jgi:hypothetical protein
MHVLSDQSVHITHTYCCVSKLSKFGAYLYSRVPPGYPNDYGYNLLCNYTILADPGRFIVVQFDEQIFEIEGKYSSPPLIWPPIL